MKEFDIRSEFKVQAGTLREGQQKVVVAASFATT